MKYNFIKNKICIFLIAIFSIAIINFNYANNVEKNIINVEVLDNGDAIIKQDWIGTFTSGTENYIPIRTGDIGIENLSVSISHNNNSYIGYKFVDNWNVNWDFDYKKNKCGIVKTSNGVELCFGISEYGNNKYHIEYLVTDFVKSYKDLDGFNFMFVNSGLNTTPTDVEVYINFPKKVNYNNCRVWGFGFNGEAKVQENGHIVAFTNSPIRENNYVTIMSSLEKGIVRSPKYKVAKSFNDVKNEAFEGSDYGYDKLDFTFILMILIFILTFGLSVYAVIQEIINKIKIKKLYKECEYYRDAPNNSNLFASHSLLLDFNVTGHKENNIIAAVMMKLINDKCLEPLTETQTGFFGIEKKQTSLKIVKEPEDTNLLEFYNILINASGEDKILQSKELEKYATSHYELVDKTIKNMAAIGRSQLSKIHCYKKIGTTKLKYLTDTGIKELKEVFGLRKFLNDFSLISEREIEEIAIWDMYMIYASLFGIAKKVLDRLKKLYPENIVKFEQYDNNINICNTYYASIWTNSVAQQMSRNARQIRRTAGYGGSVSLGGGGGFSGGGVGGGSR